MMELIALGLLAVVAGLVWGTRRMGRASARLFDPTPRCRQVGPARRAGADPTRSCARIAGFLVEIEQAGPEGVLAMTLDGRGRVPGDLELGRSRRPSADSLVTGDGRFDNRVRVAGPAGPVLALLDAQTRDAVDHAVRWHGLDVRDGRVRFAWRYPVGEARLDEAVADLVALSRRLEPHGAPSDRLLDIARQDPDRGVRRRAIALLLEGASSEAAALAAEDGEPTNLLAAAPLLPVDVAVPALMGLVRDSTAPVPQRRAAAEALLALGPETGRALLAALLETDDLYGSARDAVVEVLGREGGNLSLVSPTEVDGALTVVSRGELALAE